MSLVLDWWNRLQPLAPSSLYFYQDGVRIYHIDKLNQEQAAFVEVACQKEADSCDKKGVLLSCSLLLVVPISILAAAVFAKCYSLVFLHFLIKSASLVNCIINPLVINCVSVSCYAIGLMIGAIGVKKIWDGLVGSIHKNYAIADHLKEQALQASLQKGYWVDRNNKMERERLNDM